MFRFRLVTATIVAGLALLGARSAEAALLLPDWPGADAEFSTSAGAATDAGRDSPTPCPCDDDVPPGPCYESPSALPAAPVSSTGTTSASVGSSAGAMALLPTPVEAAGALLVDYLRRESHVLLPVPFLSGVFRPPRHLG